MKLRGRSSSTPTRTISTTSCLTAKRSNIGSRAARSIWDGPGPRFDFASDEGMANLDRPPRSSRRSPAFKVYLQQGPAGGPVGRSTRRPHLSLSRATNTLIRIHGHNNLQKMGKHIYLQLVGAEASTHQPRPRQVPDARHNYNGPERDPAPRDDAISRNGGSSKLLSLREWSEASMLCRRSMAFRPISRCSRWRARKSGPRPRIFDLAMHRLVDTQSNTPSEHHAEALRRHGRLLHIDRDRAVQTFNRAYAATQRSSQFRSA